MLSKDKNTRTTNIAKTVYSIVFITGFSVLVLFPKSFQSAKSDTINVSSNFIEGTKTPSNVISLHSIVPTVESDNEEEDTVFVYKVKPGDNLSSIAHQFGTTVKNLTQVNNLSSKTLLRVGQKLHIASTEGFMVQIDQPTNMMVFANKYNIELDDLMSVNGVNDPLQPFDEGYEIFVPESREKGIQVGLLDKPSPSTFNIYTVQPEKKKTVVTKKPTTATPSSTVQITNRPATTTNTSAPQPQQASQRATAAGYKKGSKQPHIVAQWRTNPGIINGFAAGYCTYWAAYKAPWAFPFISDKRQFKSWAGNAREWMANAQAKGFRTSKVPTEGAIMVIAEGGRSAYRSYGHVGVVLKVDRENNRILFEDMNYKGLWIVTQRWVYMNETMTQVVANSKPILGFIPKQQLPDWAAEEVDKLTKK